MSVTVLSATSEHVKQSVNSVVFQGSQLPDSLSDLSVQPPTVPSFIPQFDGNVSFTDSGEDSTSEGIKVITGMKRSRKTHVKRTPVRKVIQRIKKVNQVASIPTLSLYNMRWTWS